MSYTMASRSRLPLCSPKAMAAATGSSRMRTILYAADACVGQAKGLARSKAGVWRLPSSSAGDGATLTGSRLPPQRAPWRRAARG